VGTHDGDFGGPPEYIEMSDRYVSLADAFQALTFALDHYIRELTLPENIALEKIRGPIDFPQFQLAKEPHYDKRKATGYVPHELEEEYFPSPEIVNSQGLPSCGGYYLWMPVHTVADEEDVLHAAYKAAEVIRTKKHIPGIIPLWLVTEDFRETNLRQKEKLATNPAEFLYAMAQEFRVIHQHGKPGPVMLVSMKLTGDQLCRLVMPSTPFSMYGATMGEVTRFEGFIWRKYIPPDAIDVAWNYTP